MWSPSAVSLAANLGYNFPNGLRPFGTIGLSSLKLDQTTRDIDDSRTAFHFGTGLEYTPAALMGVSFRVGYEGDAFTIDNGFGISDTSVLIGSVYVAGSYKF